MGLGGNGGNRYHILSHMLRLNVATTFWLAVKGSPLCLLHIHVCANTTLLPVLTQKTPARRLCLDWLVTCCIFLLGQVRAAVYTVHGSHNGTVGTRRGSFDPQQGLLIQTAPAVREVFAQVWHLDFFTSGLFEPLEVRASPMDNNGLQGDSW